MPRSKKGKKQKKAMRASGAAAGDPELSLSGYKSVMWPTVLPVKLRYSDMRAIVAAGNQGTYVYRLNSVFDPDQTGVGGQPAGFDQLKTLYGRYRVMGCAVKVTACPMTSGGSAMIAMAPVDNSALSSTAEATADLRYAKAAQCQFSGAEAVLKAFYHIGRLLGYSDASMLANSNMDAAVTGNPSFQQYLLINFETTGATDTVEVRTELTYYVRMEVPTSVVDSVSTKRRFQHWRDTSQLSLGKEAVVARFGAVVGGSTPAEATLFCEGLAEDPTSLSRNQNPVGQVRVQNPSYPPLSVSSLGKLAPTAAEQPLTSDEVAALRKMLPSVVLSGAMDTRVGARSSTDV
jgi:hypothetical protein